MVRNRQVIALLFQMGIRNKVREDMRGIQALLWQQICKGGKEGKGKTRYKPRCNQTSGTLCIGIRDIHLCSSAGVEAKPRQSLQVFLSCFKSSGGSCHGLGSDPAHHNVFRIQRCGFQTWFGFKILIVGLKEEITSVSGGISCEGTFEHAWLWGFLN